ncbi:hypothetical protein EGH82_21785 [Vibrio ponticus]|uniref:Uncharacterized protein n=1 Tax=Vibrio ponticus TaxID=265668 RepID=A0A3N3DTP0_9VIBR|nr:hypothetical protein [Vibrio ponticus]ROV57719.1 hypothetical protein EGH82_21785 [Vibrio ponticus]
MDLSRFRELVRIVLFAVMVSLFTSASWAVHDNGVFELEGNAFDDAAVDGDDWENVFNEDDAANVSVFIADPSPVSIFTGGRKDIQDIPDWSHKNGSVPDKDDLTNGYAAAYGVDDGNGGQDLIIYFGADRFANVGDAFMGFWFFQDEVKALPDGTFSGEHINGDVLILVEYPQGANAVPYIAIVLWDNTCNKADSNDPAPGDCAAKNLRLEAESDTATNSAECGAADSDFGCAITNHSDENSPWPYTPKAGDANVFPFESIYEGGVNITQLLGGTGTCFSSYMAETRSSSSFTASLKDFILGEFELCGMEVVKTCTGGAVSSTGDSIIYNYNIDVTNTGFGTLFDINVDDTTAGDSFYTASLGVGATESYSGSFETTTIGILNEATVTAATKTGGEIVIDVTAESTCPIVNPPATMNITKQCETLVEKNAAGAYGLLVNYNGEVCNTSKVRIDGVVIEEKHDGITVNIPVGSIPPEDCTDYSGSYIPSPSSDVENGAVAAHNVRTFTDTVFATGENAITGADVDTGLLVEANCPLCPAP